MSTIETEVASVRLALAQAIAEKGEDYLYERPEVIFVDGEWRNNVHQTCVYVVEADDDNEPKAWCSSCLWGHVLITLGVEPGALTRVNHINIDHPSMADLLPWTDPRITAAAVASQQRQDYGGTWGQAVARFEESLRGAGVTV